jgi:hypothetical protein
VWPRFLLSGVRLVGDRFQSCWSEQAFRPTPIAKDELTAVQYELGIPTNDFPLGVQGKLFRESARYDCEANPAKFLLPRCSRHYRSAASEPVKFAP